MVANRVPQKSVAVLAMERKHSKPRLILFVLTLILPVALVLSLGTGAMSLEPSVILFILQAKTLGFWALPDTVTPIQEAVVWNIRLPRVMMGLGVGAVMGICGTAMQGLFRNQLADPSIVGISSGAALFASASIVLGSAWAGTHWAGISLLSVASFIGALVSTLFIFSISKSKRGMSVGTMLLAGIAINAIAGACMGLFSFIADEAQLRSLTFWTLGSLGGSNWPQALLIIGVTIVTTIGISVLHKPLNALALGEQEMQFLGLSNERLKWQVIILTALAIGVSVAFCGMIGFVGLVVPHILRFFVGADHRWLLPASALGGAILLVAADTLSRTVIAPAELPIGILTALLGAPLFLWRVYKQKG